MSKDFINSDLLLCKRQKAVQELAQIGGGLRLIKIKPKLVEAAAGHEIVPGVLDRLHFNQSLIFGFQSN